MAPTIYRPCIIDPVGIPELSVISPTKPGDEPVVAFLLQLTKGLVNSLPYSRAAKETVANLVNDRLNRDRSVVDQHPLFQCGLLPGNEQRVVFVQPRYRVPIVR
jgi:hypothetical protein